MSTVDERNAKRSQAEVAGFLKRPPERYTAYLSGDKKHVTTWVGDILAVVLNEGPKHKRTSSVSNERRTFEARGINGVLYRGIHNGGGMWLTMRKVKVAS